MNDVVKEYLVSLGFDINHSSFNEFQKTLRKSDELVEDLGLTTVSSFATATIAVTTFVVAAITGISKFIVSVAEADMEYQKFARQMWTSVDNAKAVKTSLDALGVSMEDLWLSPELLRQFKELRAETDKLRPPKEFTQQMKYIRSIQFEFAKARLEMTYASQWVTYYLVKYLEKPLAQLHTSLKKMNDAIVKYMPVWTKYIAQILSWAVRLGAVIFRVITEILKALGRIPNVVKAVLIALAGLSAYAMMNPFTLIIISILALLLLLDDLFTYLDGGESMFGDFWKKLEDFSKEPMFQELLKSAGQVDESLGKILDKMYELGEQIVKSIGSERMNKIQGGLKIFADFLTFVLNTALQYTLTLLDGILFALDGIGKAFDGTLLNDLMKPNPDGPFAGGGIAGFQAPTVPTNGNQVTQSLYPIGYSGRTKDSVEVTSNPTFNIYGTDPVLTSWNVVRQQESLLLRSLQGVKK